MNERNNFNQTRVNIEHDITIANNVAKQHDEIVHQAEQDARASHNKVRTLTQNLSRAALRAITHDDQAAWEFVAASCDTKPEEWKLVQERLPKLIALQDDPTEIYINLRSGYGGTVSTANLVTGEKLDVILQNSYLQLSGPRSDRINAITALTPAKQIESYRQSPSSYSGNLLGHAEVGNFLRSVENNPECTPLLYNIALELIDKPQAAKHWERLAPASKPAIVDECFLFLERLHGSYADKYSREAEEYPKVMKLLATEAGIDQTEEYYDQISSLADWRKKAQHTSNESRKDSDVYRVLTNAYFSWREIKENRGWEMP
jgi:hypothetical protein